MLLFDNTLFKNGRHFDYCNQLLNMRVCVCYLDCHEAGLYCSLVIEIENLLRPLQLLLPFVTYLLTLPRIITYLADRCQVEILKIVEYKHTAHEINYKMET
jgi:hypothetical protein